MPKAVLLGCPDDRGVANNNGRIGAAGGPAAFRKAFQRLKGRYPLHDHLLDLGDAAVDQEALRQNLEHAAVRFTAALKDADTALMVGGGHDYGYPFLKGLRHSTEAEAVIGCINIDPHFDLRPDDPEVLSGSPFYMAIERGVLVGPNLVEFGIQRHCNADFLWQYAADKGVHTVLFDRLRGGQAVEAFRVALDDLCQRCDHVAISLDLDCFQAAYAPGVSAPAVEGFTPSEVLEMLRIAATVPKVSALGIFELNPVYDQDERTARLAAVCAWHFLEERLFGAASEE